MRYSTPRGQTVVQSKLAKRQLLGYRIGILGAALFGILLVSWLAQEPVEHWEHEVGGRSLLSGGENKAEWEKCDYEEDHVPAGFAVLYILVILHMFVGIAILCDDYFVPVLEDISEALHLSDDVAGATFMAAGFALSILSLTIDLLKLTRSAFVGSSAPELFTSLAGVSVDSDVGVGTIVGSAVFNILVIVAMSAAFGASMGKGSMEVDWRCLLRDGLHYGISIVAFIIFAWDGYFQWWEAVVLIALYIVYLIHMKFNERIMKYIPRGGKVAPIQSNEGDKTVSLGDEENAKPFSDMPQIKRTLSPQSSSASLSSYNKLRRTSSLTGLNEEVSQNLAKMLETQMEHESKEQDSILKKTFSRSDSAIHLLGSSTTDVPHPQFHVQHSGRLSSVLTGRQMSIRNEIARLKSSHSFVGSSNDIRMQPESTDKSLQRVDDVEEDDPKKCGERCCFPCSSGCPGLDDNQSSQSCGSIFALCWIRLKFFITMVYDWAFMNTIPPRKYYWSSFCICILWIMIISFVMVTAVIRLGCILTIDDYVMGLIVIAAGTSVPDAMGSILVANQGFADMAVANALGSNVFDIDLGIGIPFLLKILIIGGKFDLLSESDRTALDRAKMRGNTRITDHVKFGFLLLGILFLTLIIFKLMKFKLSKKLGVGFMFMYIIFIGYALAQELACKRQGILC